MCDYSLMGVPNRLANPGEALVLYTFPTGTKGFTSPSSIRCTQSDAGLRSIWLEIKSFLKLTDLSGVPAVCIPPGSRLLLHDIPSDLQQSLKAAPTELVLFVNSNSDPGSHRDAIRFRNGAEVSLQCLPEGVRVRVLDVDLSTEEVPAQFDGLAIQLG